MNPPSTSAVASAKEKLSPWAWGAVFGLSSSLIYTAANSCLRAVSDLDPFWVSAVKAAPTALIMLVWLAADWRRGKSAGMPLWLAWAIAIAGIEAQIVGNCSFQWALGEIGLALSVSLCLGGMIITATLLGRLFLKEAVSIWTLASLVVLLGAIGVLSLGAEDARKSVTQTAVATPGRLLLGVGMAALSGFGYAVLNVLIRYAMTRGASIPATLSIVSLVGLFTLGGISHARIGLTGMAASQPLAVGYMLAAGVFNAIAFAALTRSLQLTSVAYFNALNASQAAFAALAGTFFFGEAFTIALCAGVALTIVGLAMLTRRGTPSAGGTGNPDRERLRLQIRGVIEQAEEVTARIRQQLPSHEGLLGAARHVVDAAREAQRVSRRLRGWFGWHRAPAVFLAVVLAVAGFWVWQQFFRVYRLKIALPDRDAVALREKLSTAERLQFETIAVPGSREAVELLDRGEVDLGFVQGGLEIPRELPRLENPGGEYVLWFVRRDLSLEQVRTVLTSTQGEGSHTVAQKFFELWKFGHPVAYRHLWRELSTARTFAIPDEIDAVFVVKDPADPQTIQAVERLASAGFELRPLDLGARSGALRYLAPITVRTGYFRFEPPVPEREITTYAVVTYLVARRGLTPRLHAHAASLLESAPSRISDLSFSPDVERAGSLLQGLDSGLSILVYVGVAFLALLGLEMSSYRKRFHELNSLVSLLSMLQSNKDVLGIDDPRQKRENLAYLSLCSDLLSLVSAISGYYTQENSSLLFNNLSEVIHQRCDGLKLNIQIKILHSLVAGSGAALENGRGQR